jgi:hypothetical protein
MSGSPGKDAVEFAGHGIAFVLAGDFYSVRVRPFCYAWGTMSALNGDKARFNRERKAKLARRERSLAIRNKLKGDPKPGESKTQAN